MDIFMEVFMERYFLSAVTQPFVFCFQLCVLIFKVLNYFTKSNYLIFILFFSHCSSPPVYNPQPSVPAARL